MTLYEFTPRFRGDSSVPMVVDYEGHFWNDLKVVEYLDENDVNVADGVTLEEIDDLSGQLMDQLNGYGGPPKKVRSQ